MGYYRQEKYKRHFDNYHSCGWHTLALATPWFWSPQFTEGHRCSTVHVSAVHQVNYATFRWPNYTHSTVLTALFRPNGGIAQAEVNFSTIVNKEHTSPSWFVEIKQTQISLQNR